MRFHALLEDLLDGRVLHLGSHAVLPDDDVRRRLRRVDGIDDAVVVAAAGKFLVDLAPDERPKLSLLLGRGDVRPERARRRALGADLAFNALRERERRK